MQSESTEEQNLFLNCITYILLSTIIILVREFHFLHSVRCTVQAINIIQAIL